MAKLSYYIIGLSKLTVFKFISLWLRELINIQNY